MAVQFLLGKENTAVHSDEITDVTEACQPVHVVEDTISGVGVRPSAGWESVHQLRRHIR